MDKIFNYKYYVLDKNQNAFGVIDESFGNVKYHALKIEKVFDQFQNKEIDTIVRWGEERQQRIQKLQEAFTEIDITKDYWRVFEHMTGRKRKAVSNSSEA